VYLLARSEEKTKKAIESIKVAVPKSSGTLTFIHLDLADLTNIRATADAFHSHESQLHLLFNNAGVAMPASGSKTKQGYELQMGVNCLGSFALTKLLTPTLVATSKAVASSSSSSSSSSQPGSVRVVWVSSNASEAVSPRDFVKSAENVEKMRNPLDRYGVSKLGNYLHAGEFAAQMREHGIVSMPVNPGALDSDLWRDQSVLVQKFLRATLLHPPVYGAYTCLYAAFSPEVTLENSGTYSESTLTYLRALCCGLFGEI
jgi:retinol dehydrogenase 12